MEPRELVGGQQAREGEFHPQEKVEEEPGEVVPPRVSGSSALCLQGGDSHYLSPGCRPEPHMPSTSHAKEKKGPVQAEDACDPSPSTATVTAEPVEPSPPPLGEGVGIGKPPSLFSRTCGYG